MTACHDVPEYNDTPQGNFDALADIIDTRYCFLDSKGLDWQQITSRYRSLVTSGTTDLELFRICSTMLDELEDGHVNLSAPFSTSYYRKWWSDYPQNFSLRCVQQYYLNFDYMQTSGMSYKILHDKIGYILYPSFSSTIGNLNLDYVLAYLQPCQALIIDIRDNGGGQLTNVETLVARFITTETAGGYIRHKTGPGHSDFSEPYPLTYAPAEKGRVTWGATRPVYVITNRSCYSAANHFVSVMKTLPNVHIAGARTGGGGGLPTSYELPNGWSVRLSSSPMLDRDGHDIEQGIEPDSGYALEAPADQLAAGHDAILDYVIAEILSN